MTEEAERDEHTSVNTERDEARVEARLQPNGGGIQDHQETAPHNATGPVGGGGRSNQPVDAKSVEELFESLPKARQQRLIATYSVESHYSGPLPQAAELAAYNEAIPDGAHRIMEMAERQLDAAIRVSDAEVAETPADLDGQPGCLAQQTIVSANLSA